MRALDVEDIDRQITALQAERLKAVQRKEREVLQGLKGFLAKVAPERLEGFVAEVRKVCDSEAAARK